MSNINLKRFVDINIQSHVTSVVSGTRDTVVLYTSEGEDNTPKLITSLSEAQTTYSNAPNTLAYLTVYFNNGGVNALVIGNTPYNSITAEMIKALDNKYILVAYAASSSELTNAYTKLKQIAQEREADTATIDGIYGINEKIILARTESFADSDSVKNFAVKYSTVQGAEMTMAAYLSKINVYSINSIFDYAFTNENITASEISDENFNALITNNINVDIDLANSIRNCGGNCKDGADLTNSFVKIILHQTLTDSLINLLSQKIKNSSGLGKIYTTISQELEHYLNAGYLTTDKIWTDNTLYITKNNVKYTIIEQGTPLINGYHITVLPMSSLTPSEKAEHKAPIIYVIIADSYGIRKITINGEVI